MYCHIGSQWGRVPTQVWAWRPDSERGVDGQDGAQPNKNII